MKKADKQHLSRIAELGCVVCRNLGHGPTPAEIHHPRWNQGMGQRAKHSDAIPLCPHHHRLGGYGEAIHAGQEIWMQKHGTEVELVEQTKREAGG